MEKIKEYTNGEVTIVWKPGSCIHSAKCVKGLPAVFKPKDKPWIQVEAASTSELIEQVGQCPSGALSHYMNSEGPEETSPAGTKVEVMVDGPLLVHGTLEVNLNDGSSEVKKRTTAFCRCGHSHNKPYCDGAHTKENFRG